MGQERIRSFMELDSMSAFKALQTFIKAIHQEMTVYFKCLPFSNNKSFFLSNQYNINVSEL